MFLTDGGLETTLVFLDGIDLPGFAAFPLFADEGGRAKLRGLFRPYLATAARAGAGFILDTPTGAPMPTGARRSAIRQAALAEINRQSVAMAADLRDAWATQETPIVLNGVLGPRGDGYRADARMSADEAQELPRGTDPGLPRRRGRHDQRHHHDRTRRRRSGSPRAAKTAGLPAAISFTVETDGKASPPATRCRR